MTVAISLWQPWAHAIALGLKKIETRTWPTNYRGPVAIHAGKKRTGDLVQAAHRFGFMDELPRGCVVATATIVDCVRMSQAWIDVQRNLERDLGNFVVGNYGFILEDQRRLRVPVAMRGQQGFWTLTKEQERAVFAEALRRP